jgi:DNA-binding CsgD family transcriptional regulator
VCAAPRATYYLVLYGPASFASEAATALEPLAPHFARAAELKKRQRVDYERSTALDAALERLSVGIALVWCDGQLAYANREARRVLADKDGLSLVVGRVMGADFETSRAMDSGAASPTGAASFEVRAVARPSGRRPYQVAVQRVAIDARDPGCPGELPNAVWIVDPELSPSFSPAELVAALGLTPAEARLAAAIAHGLSPRETAARSGHSVETARTTLKRVFAKLGVRRQAELARMVARSIGAWVLREA